MPPEYQPCRDTIASAVPPLLVAAALVVVSAAASLPAAGPPLPRQWFLNAHNSYPQEGRGADRLQRARRARIWEVEVDVAWSEPRGRTVVSHEAKPHGEEPALEDYFVAPLLPELRRLPPDRPGLLLMPDLKTDHPGPVRELHKLLRRHRDLLTTSSRGGELRIGPLTVILSSAIALFEQLTPAGEPYQALVVREPPERQYQEDLAACFPYPATAFYRLFNFDWKHIEKEANRQAGAFTAAERPPLRELVKLVNQKGYWTRAWTLNATNADWDKDRAFGRREALLERWRAARDRTESLLWRRRHSGAPKHR